MKPIILLKRKKKNIYKFLLIKNVFNKLISKYIYFITIQYVNYIKSNLKRNAKKESKKKTYIMVIYYIKF